ncbi:hypothetical protein Pla52n_18000 [Stieleria varia]|uniref:Uncharacterized protein n=1 Tax=Stieleria varia TaxID=2528005 RepID=A0A5C6B2D6_9BACT|nr:hypothetical protein Pla52n_18000 [Stieleria varia]
MKEYVHQRGLQCVGPLPDLASLDPTSPGCAGGGDRKLAQTKKDTTPNFEQSRVAGLYSDALYIKEGLASLFSWLVSFLGADRAGRHQELSESRPLAVSPSVSYFVKRSMTYGSYRLARS